MVIGFAVNLNHLLSIPDAKFKCTAINIENTLLDHLVHNKNEVECISGNNVSYSTLRWRYTPALIIFMSLFFQEYVSSPRSAQ